MGRACVAADAAFTSVERSRSSLLSFLRLQDCKGWLDKTNRASRTGIQKFTSPVLDVFGNNKQ